MKPIKTYRSNFVYAGPTPEILDLPCEVAVVDSGPQDGALITYSVWELNEEERESIARGGKIKLGIFHALPIPPVSLQIVHEEAPE